MDTLIVPSLGFSLTNPLLDILYVVAILIETLVNKCLKRVNRDPRESASRACIYAFTVIGASGSRNHGMVQILQRLMTALERDRILTVAAGRLLICIYAVS